jgi:hypothetical protein
VRGRRLTAWAMARPKGTHTKWSSLQHTYTKTVDIYMQEYKTLGR